MSRNSPLGGAPLGMWMCGGALLLWLCGGGALGLNVVAAM